MPTSIFEQIIPPILYNCASALKSKISPPRRDPDVLFEGDDRLFKSIVSSARVYGEYGCGASTIWMARKTRTRILAIDTSRAWIAEVTGHCKERPNLSLQHCDLGEIGEWGRPVGYKNHERFHIYTDWIWEQADKPDVVLIDGRFRICCFLTSLRRSTAGTAIIFDDYTNRPQYHFVEEFLKPSSILGRQAVFITPSLSAAEIQKIDGMIDRFRFVMD